MRSGGDWERLVPAGVARHPFARARARRALGSAPRVSDRRRSARRARRPCARRPRRTYRQRGGAHARARRALSGRARAACSTRSGLGGRRRPRSRTGRCSATADEFRDAPCSKRSAAGRRCRRSTSSPTRTASRAAARRLVADRQAGPRARCGGGRAARRGCDGIEVDGLSVLARARLARRGRRAGLGCADERVTDSTRSFATATRFFARSRSYRRRRGPRAPAWTREAMRRLEGERFNVITLKWWGRPTAVLTSSGTVSAVPSSASRRSSAASRVGSSRCRTGDGRSVADLRRRIARARERLDVGDTFVFVHQKTTDARAHQGSDDQARHDRAAGRGARRTAARPRRRLRDR